MEILDELVTATEAAAIIGIHRNNVLKAIRAGNLPAMKIGGRFLIQRAEAEIYAASRKKNPPPGG